LSQFLEEHFKTPSQDFYKNFVQSLKNERKSAKHEAKAIAQFAKLQT